MTVPDSETCEKPSDARLMPATLQSSIASLGNVAQASTPPIAMAALRHCSLLFADSFHHDRFCQHVDEVRFKEPVIITACEIVELRESSLCPTLDLKGTTSPESCVLEFYVRSGRDSRFQRLGPAFLHSPAATSFLDVQAAVTEHMVLRGSYKSLSLVVYGNLASELCLENKLDTSDSSPKAISESDQLREVLHTHSPRTLSLSNLSTLSSPNVEQRNVLQRLLKCVGRVDTTHHLVSMLLTAAAASWHLSPQRLRNGVQWFTVKKLDSVNSGRSLLCDDPVQELSELHDLVQQKEDEGGHMPSNDGNSEMLVRLSQHWLQAGLEPSAGVNPALTSVESLVGGLAAVQLLCSSCPQDVPAFLAAGGMRLLHEVVEEVSGTTALLLFALTSVECLLRHGCACEAFLSQGKKALIALLENKQRPPVIILLYQILQRLQCYELSVAFGKSVTLLKKSGMAEDEIVIYEATKLLNDLLSSLNMKGFVERGSPENNWTKRDEELLTSYRRGCNEITCMPQDVDPALLSVLQETRFMASLAAFSSVPYIWSGIGSASNVCIEFAFATQRLLLRLLECRSGLLFLNGDTESLVTLMSALKNTTEQESEVVPIRHVAVLSSMGYLCTPWCIAEILQSRISMVTAMDRFIGADRGSKAAFGALCDLATMSRSEAGRQAILALVSFPEVLISLIEALHPSPDSEQIVGGTAGHFAAKVLQKLFCDPALTNQVALTAHASTLQTALETAGNEGMSTFSKLVEWVEAAVVYNTKGAVGLLKHAGALIGPQNTSITLHVDGSVDDDANNLRDRTPGSELPKSSSKGLGPAGIQDSAIHALTISLRLLASAGWNSEVAALVYGEGAMGVVNVILEHCLAALQASSNEYDEEEAEEEEGRGEDVHKDQALLALLMPTLLLLLFFLKRLQGVVQHHCSTKFLDLLTQLHQVVSAKAGAHGTVPPYSWTGGQLELGAVQQVLASLLAFWPVFSWTPALLPRLLGPSSTSLPMEPGEVCSVIWLLEEFLPPERPRLNMDKAAVADVCRAVGIGDIQGIDVMSAVLWHTSSIHSEKMLHALYPYFEQIGQLVVRLVPCKCDAFQERLANLVIRLACQSPENAAILVRPVLLLLQQRTAAAAKSLLSDTDVFQVTYMLQWVTLLAAHPSSKAVLLQEGAVGMLLQILSLDATSNVPVAKLDWLVCSFRALALACDIAISFSPAAPTDRHMSEDCPHFSDSCAVASSLLRHCQMMHLEPRTEFLADALEKLASHDVGRAALASVALGNAGFAMPTNIQDTPESQVSWALDKNNSPLLKLWQNFTSAMELVESDAAHLRLILRFAQVANVLTDSGQSLVGGVALKALFGLDVSFEAMELEIVGVQPDKLETLSRVVSILEHILEVEDSGVSTCGIKSSAQEALSAVSSMLNFLNTPAKPIALHDEIRSLLARLPPARPVAERRAEAVAAQTSACVGLISSAVFVEGANLMDMDVRNSSSETMVTIPWDCPKLLHNRPVATSRTLKRRVISTVEVASTRRRSDATVSEVASRTTVLVTSNRRDTFRLRKPNTSRPPSMHVDDYVAREKSSDVLPGSNPATLATPLQRSNSGTERATFNPLDEVLAWERDHQQAAAPPPGIQGYVENGGTRTGLDVPEGAYDGGELGFSDGISHIVQTSAEYSSVNMLVSGVTTCSVAPPTLGLMTTAGMNTEFATVPETLLRRMLPLSELSACTSQTAGEVKSEQNNGIAVKSCTQPPSLVKVKLERTPSLNSASAGPPSPFRSYEQEIITAGAPAVKKETWQQSDRNFMARTSHGEASTVSNFSTHNALSQQVLHSDITSHLPPPPPPAPPSLWSDAPRKPDTSPFSPVVPRLIPGMNLPPYNHGTGLRSPAGLQVGGTLLQPPAGLWRDSPTLYSGLPPPAPPMPGPIQHGSLHVQQPLVGTSQPLDTLPAYPGSHAGSASTSGHRFGNFGGPPPGQGSSSLFQFPVPTGITPSQITLHSEQSVHPSPLYSYEPDITAQQEPGAVLQQILQSPETIQELLKDPKKLQQLLEQHPKLITLLQAHLRKVESRHAVRWFVVEGNNFLLNFEAYERMDGLYLPDVYFL